MFWHSIYEIFFKHKSDKFGKFGTAKPKFDTFKVKENFGQWKIAISL